MPSAVAAQPTVLQRFESEFANSRKLHEQAKSLFPNGVTHDLRHLEPFPIYVDRAAGAYKWDVDGHQLIDFWSGHGALLLGHSHPEVVAAVQRQMARATHPGACHELEIEWGQWVQRLVPSAEKMRFTSSGTEATLMALRLSRIHTGKPRVLKFAGHFHGWHDFLIPAADPPYDNPAVPGIPPDAAGLTVVIPPNDPAAVERALAQDSSIGCVILEPTGGHFGAVPLTLPSPPGSNPGGEGKGRGGAFLRALRDITAKQNRLLIFDEVISGFRVHPGGAQGHYKVVPDLTTMAKVLAGGLPGGCLAGRADVLAHLEFRAGKPKMKHPGTFNANPLSAAAGTTALRLVAGGEPCRRANDMASLLRRKLNDLFAQRGLDWVVYGEFSGFKFLPHYDGPRPANDDFIPYGGDWAKLDTPKDRNIAHAFRRAMLLCGVDLPGLAGMTSMAHTQADIEQTVEATGHALTLLQEDGGI